MKLKVYGLAILIAFISSCGDGKKEQTPAKNEVVKEVVTEDPMQDKGVGPVTNISLGEINQEMAEQGKVIFASKCSACHKINKRFVGPALIGVTERRTPEWIMNMILNPEVMVVENAEAKKLLAEYLSPMANQNLTESEARAILEYFRTKTSSDTEE